MGDANEEPALSWLNKEFLQEILSTDDPSITSVSKIDITRAVGKGENYASLLLRVSVEFSTNDLEDKKTSLIIKSLPAGDLLQVFLKELGAFSTENRIYLETMPAMHRLLEEKMPTATPEIFGPRAFRCERPYTLVLEDLRDKHFRMSDRHAGLDLKHALLVLRKLAKLHAASAVLHIEDPAMVDGYEEGFYKESKREMLEQYMPHTFNSLAKVVDKWEGYERYGDKLREFGKICTDRLIKVMKPSETFLSVLNHGDCWVNNCMFRYGEVSGEVEEVRFVDFQLARYTSPVIDVLYFIYTSVQDEVRVQCYDQLLGEYHAVLGETLEGLGYGDRLFSPEQLEQEMEQRAVFGLVAACTVLCAVLADPDDAIDMEHLNEEDLKSGQTNIMDKAMGGARYRAALQKLLPHFERNGLL